MVTSKYLDMSSDSVNFNVHFETSRGVSQLCPDNVFKQVSDSVELHDVFWLALQPELVKFYEEIAEKRILIVPNMKSNHDLKFLIPGEER